MWKSTTTLEPKPENDRDVLGISAPASRTREYA